MSRFVSGCAGPGVAVQVCGYAGVRFQVCRCAGRLRSSSIYIVYLRAGDEGWCVCVCVCLSPFGREGL